MGKIKKLPDSVARKIAAGEVIEKPASVLRELLDNSIDSGATEIEIRITEGGIKEISIVDNGCGMSKSDLILSIQPHATSKIESAEDLYQLSTLGFRGEALSSITSCCRLQIKSREQNSDKSYKINCEDGKIVNESSSSGTKGTQISVKDIFYSMPGRKKFLKSQKGESTSCLNVFMDKAAAFPNITFRYFNENKLKHFLPADSYLERIKLLYKNRIDHSLLREEKGIIEGPSEIDLVLTTPSSYRRDRKQIQIYINNRRIHEFALIQAIEWGYSEFLPGGCFPSCFLFLKINPKMVDFNIHPAKREAKIYEIKEIRKQVIDSIKRFLATFNSGNRYVEAAQRIANLQLRENNPLNNYSSDNDLIPKQIMNESIMFKKEISYPNKPQQRKANKNSLDFKFIGIFNTLFLLASKNEILYIIDQHAAHERILFDKYCENSSSQPLLITQQIPNKENKTPHQFSTLFQQNLKNLGITISFENKTTWVINSIPDNLKTSLKIVANMLPDLPENLFELRKKLFATLACKNAVKDGYLLDWDNASKIAKEALELPQPTCPHGRPVYFPLTKEELFQLVGRDI